MSFTSGPGGTLEESPALVALHDVDAAIGRLAETNLWAVPASELLELRVDAEATRARLDAVVLSMTREIDGRGAATEAGAASTAAGCAVGFACTPAPPRRRWRWLVSSMPI